MQQCSTAEAADVAVICSSHACTAAPALLTSFVMPVVLGVVGGAGAAALLLLSMSCLMPSGSYGCAGRQCGCG